MSMVSNFLLPADGGIWYIPNLEEHRRYCGVAARGRIQVIAWEPGGSSEWSAKHRPGILVVEDGVCGQSQCEKCSRLLLLLKLGSVRDNPCEAPFARALLASERYPGWKASLQRSTLEIRIMLRCAAPVQVICIRDVENQLYGGVGSRGQGSMGSCNET